MPLLYIFTPAVHPYPCRTGSAAIPDNELDVAWDLYRALQSFYRTHPHMQQRPLVITGEVRRAGVRRVLLVARVWRGGKSFRPVQQTSSEALPLRIAVP